MINTELSSEHKTTRILLHPFILVKDQKTVPWDPKKEPPFFFSFFCLRRDLNTWVNVMLHRTLALGSWWTRGDELSPSLLTCCGNIAGQAGAGEGQDPQGCAAHLQSGWCPAKVKLGRSKNKKQAVLVRMWGKGNPWALLVGMWIVRPLCGHCAGSSKLKIEPQALSLWGL